MNIRNWKILAVSMTVVCSLAIPAFAYTYLYRTPNYEFSTGIILRGPAMQLGFYWDFACTQPITTIDFGEMVHKSTSSGYSKSIYIRNEGENMTTIFWNSTLSATTTVITELWTYEKLGMFFALNSSNISPSEKFTTTYSINIEASPPVGTYNWTLTIWGETYI